ncbi:hypothetical protein STAL104432_29620 [Streptomyces albus]
MVVEDADPQHAGHMAAGPPLFEGAHPFLAVERGITQCGRRAPACGCQDRAAVPHPGQAGQRLQPAPLPGRPGPQPAGADPGEEPGQVGGLGDDVQHAGAQDGHLAPGGGLDEEEPLPVGGDGELVQGDDVGGARLGVGETAGEDRVSGEAGHPGDVGGPGVARLEEQLDGQRGFGAGAAVARRLTVQVRQFRLQSEGGGETAGHGARAVGTVGDQQPEVALRERGDRPGERLDAQVQRARRQCRARFPGCEPVDQRLVQHEFGAGARDQHLVQGLAQCFVPRCRVGRRGCAVAAAVTGRHPVSGRGPQSAVGVEHLAYGHGPLGAVPVEERAVVLGQLRVLSVGRGEPPQHAGGPRHLVAHRPRQPDVAVRAQVHVHGRPGAGGCAARGECVHLAHRVQRRVPCGPAGAGRGCGVGGEPFLDAAQSPGQR